MENRDFQLERIETPLGVALVVTDAQDRLLALDWQDYEARLHLLLGRQYKGQRIGLQERPASSPASKALQAYFAGDLAAVQALPVHVQGTDFQQSVWQALRSIPVGSTISYRELALQIGRPQAVRAVGLANGANPVSIVVPCHRVIGSNSKLTGYAGGLERKRWLLEHELKYARH